MSEAAVTSPPAAAGRPRVAFLAWTDRTPRADEIAASVGGVAQRFDGYGLRGRATAPLRYVLNAAGTILWLARHRPRAVVTQNPPVFVGLIAWLYGLATGVPVLLDSHPASFGRKDGLWKVMLPVHRFLARRARLVLVTAPELADEVRAWGGRATEVHEAPVAELTATPAPELAAGERLRVFYVGVFAPDEPAGAVIAAARLVPDADVRVTGDLRRAPAGLVEGAPENVTFTGFLGPEDYRRELREAHVVMTLTTDPTSVMRSGYEAVYAGRPLVTSEWPVLRATFPYAVHAEGRPDALAAALAETTRRYAELRASTAAALTHQQATWASQHAAIEEAITS